MHNSFHITKAIKYGRTFILIKSVDIGALFDQQPTHLGVGVHIGGMEDQMVKRITFVHINFVGTHLEGKQMLDLLDSEIPAPFDNLNEWYLIFDRQEIHLAFKINKDDDELILTIQRSIQ